MASWHDEKILDEIKTTGFCGCLILNKGTIYKLKFRSEPEKRKEELIHHLKKHSGELQLIIRAAIANPALEEFRSDGCLVTITKTKWQVSDKLDFFQNGRILRAHPEYFTVSLQYLQGAKGRSSSNIVPSHSDVKKDRQTHSIKVSGSKLHPGSAKHKGLQDLVSTVSELYQSEAGVPDCALQAEFYKGWQGHKKGLQDLHADSVSQLNHGRQGNEDGQRHNNTERKRKLVKKSDLDVPQYCGGDLRGHRASLSKKPKDSLSVVVDIDDHGRWNRGQGSQFQNEAPLISGTTCTSSHGGHELGHGLILSMSQAENDTGVNDTCNVSSSCDSDLETERRQDLVDIDNGVTHSHDGIPFKDNLVLASRSNQQRRPVVLPVRRKLQDCGTHECTPKQQAIPRQRDRFRIDSEELSEAMKLQAYATPTVTSECCPEVPKQDRKITSSSTSSRSFQNVLGVVTTPLKQVKKLFH